MTEQSPSVAPAPFLFVSPGDVWGCDCWASVSAQRWQSVDMESRSFWGFQGLDLQDSHGAPGCSSVGSLWPPLRHPQLLSHLVYFHHGFSHVSRGYITTFGCATQQVGFFSGFNWEICTIIIMRRKVKMKLACFGKEELGKSLKNHQSDYNLFHSKVKKKNIRNVLFVFMEQNLNCMVYRAWENIFLSCLSSAGWLVHASSVFLLAHGGYRGCGALWWTSSCVPSFWVQGDAAEDSAFTWPTNETHISRLLIVDWAPGGILFWVFHTQI